MPVARLDHVALLVADLEAAVGRVGVGLLVSPPADFPGEGTREAYVGGATHDARLLLVTPLEPAGDGHYARALRGRGPGLHHLGLAVPDVAAYVEGLAGSGWYVLPGTVAGLPDSAWLARPGVPVLLEVAVDRATSEAPVVTRVEVPEGGRAGLVGALGVPALVPSPDGEAWLTLAGERRAARWWSASPDWR